jgi:putative SbcD/Mre11-related phosphoesterase
MIRCAAMQEARLPTFDGWQFTPEGAVVHDVEQTAVIADLHLGYEWARGAAGDCVYAHSLEDTLTRLSTLLDRFTVSRLIIAGDLIESARPCPFTARDVERLKCWLADRGVGLLVLEGNHDVGTSRSPKRPRGVPCELLETCVVAGWTIGHGHRPIKGSARISGHHHPVFRWQGIVAPCFLAGPGQIVLPAFSRDAAGCNILSRAVPKDWLGGSLRCLVGTGDEVLDFGPLAKLRHELREQES